MTQKLDLSKINNEVTYARLQDMQAENEQLKKEAASSRKSRIEHTKTLEATILELGEKLQILQKERKQLEFSK